MLAKSFRNKYLDRLRFAINEVSVVRDIGEYRGRQHSLLERAGSRLPALERLAVADAAESANRMMGISAPRDRVEAIVLNASHPENPAEEAIAGYRDALQLIHGPARPPRLTVSSVQHLHEAASRSQTGAMPAATGAPPEALEDLVNGYVRAIAQEREPMVLIPLAVLDFNCIRPFAEANARTALLLPALLFANLGTPVARYISFERIIESSKDRYHAALDESSHRWHSGKHDVIPWLQYFWGVVIAAARELEDLGGATQAGKGGKTAAVERAVRRQIRPFAMADIERECPDVSHDMVRHVLRELRSAGEIESTGRGRGARWFRRKRPAAAAAEAATASLPPQVLTKPGLPSLHSVHAKPPETR